ncbi:prephenate dehydratase [Domibacillus epiphyticus]|uniref:Prephenate dehydratase n=1 Tax=Domibacillus epiphyticus TaxID=1714355 RepID=A0A1V2A990_9BACI|nr:prephenate dehydratase [Domibacillus epiphyticus]OMP67558.1 prephenate dehydratase [Domibacillus epiphyticus]
MRKIAFLGPAATFTDIAVSDAFPEDERIPCVTIPECMDFVLEEKADLAVVPIENALEGTVNMTIDHLFHEANLTIVGELTAPIQQHLLVHPDHAEHWKDAVRILSHPHAIAQCHKFLSSEFYGVPSQQMTSTAAAAKYVSEHPEQCIAAIANSLSAKEYGLVTVQADIHDFNFNHTRFLVLSKTHEELTFPLPKTGGKTTIVVTLPTDRPGTLHQVLATFAWRNLNLGKIESRPLKTGLGNYFFIIDVAQRIDDVLVPGAFAEMEALGCTVQVLGSYYGYEVGQAKNKV